MPRKAKELSALEIGRLKDAGHHAVGGVAGLYLYVNDDGARSWVMRLIVGTKRRHMGLGGFPDVPVSLARDKARKVRQDVEAGIDPIAARHSAKSALASQQAADKTFKGAAEAFIKANADAWKNPKHRAQWTSSLETYAYPHMGNLLVRDVTLEHVMKTIEPIWKSKNETASRVRGRIEKVLDWATVRKLREGENPARWKGHLEMILPSPTKIKKVEHHRALPVRDVPKFFASLQEREGTAARALTFTILCASRSGEVRGGSWEEVDLKHGVWTIPGERMKAGHDHRVPLPKAALQILLDTPKEERAGLLFPAPRGGQLSDMTLTAVLRRMEVDAVPHGFRSTFRDWVGEVTDFPRELAELALAHTLESKVEAAYRRGDALEKRREMMEAWAKFCASAI